MPAKQVKSWSSTLRLPKSTFPPRAHSQDSKKYINRVTDQLYKWQAKERREQKPFMLNDGPPYANGELHVGHAINKITKDLINRVELHQGKRIQYVPGWDCHGLPIEIKALEAHREKNAGGAPLDTIGIRRAARKLASKTVESQMKNFMKWAVMGDWENAWTTMKPHFEISQLKVFQEMVKQGLIFRRFKPVYWSPSSGTALAEAELEYKDDHKSTAAYVKFPFATVSQELWSQGADATRLRAIIWTTTPWTLPANRAIAVHRDLEYTIIEVGNEQLLVAKSRLDHIAKACLEEGSFRVIVDSIMGSDLEGSTYTNNLRGSESEPQPVILADFVSADSGSGLVHLAPGHGMDDYEVCQTMKIPAVAPVDDMGCFTAAALPDNPDVLKGKSVLEDGSAAVLELLGHHVLKVHTYEHKYPYDWRTKLPIIVRATEQWFADVGSLKEKALKNLKDVKFVPESGRGRLESFVKGRSEWCISRQRAWGVPIPALYDEAGKAVLTEESVRHIISVISERGIDAWWTDPADDPAWLPIGLKGVYKRGMDTMDVWFDSGTSWTQSLGQADVYCEGTDQHRGWFQSSLLTYTSASGIDGAPFKKLITHGFTLDKDGKKMSKSLGNIIKPDQIMDGTVVPAAIGKGKGKVSPFSDMGPDALRLWVASVDYTRDVVLSEEVFRSIYTMMNKYRTTFKVMLGLLHQNHASLPLTNVDMVALYQLREAMKGVLAAYQVYDFHKAVAIVNKWINVDFSAFYLEAAKDRLYCGDGGGVIYQLYNGLLQMLAPITPLLITQAWDYNPNWLKDDICLEHPLHRTLQDGIVNLYCAKSIEFPATIERDISAITGAKSAISTALEEARGQKLIGSSLQSSVVLSIPSGNPLSTFQNYLNELEAIFVVSSIELGDGKGVVEDRKPEWHFMAEFEVGGQKAEAWVLPPKDHKCPRCWRYVAPVEDELCGRCDEEVKIVEAAKEKAAR